MPSNSNLVKLVRFFMVVTKYSKHTSNQNLKKLTIEQPFIPLFGNFCSKWKNGIDYNININFGNQFIKYLICFDTKILGKPFHP